MHAHGTIELGPSPPDAIAATSMFSHKTDACSEPPCSAQLRAASLNDGSRGRRLSRGPRACISQLFIGSGPSHHEEGRTGGRGTKHDNH